MKKILWFLSGMSITAVASTAHANGTIYLANGDKKISMTVATPPIQTSSESELNEAINRLSASNSSSSDYNYATTQNSQHYATTQNHYGSQFSGNQFSSNQFSGSQYNQYNYSKAKTLPASAPPSIAASIISRTAHSRSQGRCALYVRRALQSAGYDFTPQSSAYMYAYGTLQSAGFTQINSKNYQPQVGDVVVFNRTSKNPHGHIQIYDGNQWVSDFYQPKFSPYSQHNGYSVWRDSRYMDASNQGTYFAMND